ncbi:MAG: GC-type dockerin domain-anchored protein [Planctomycetota bacterium]
MPVRMFIAFLVAFVANASSAQFDPLNGQWGKDVESDIRVMTWNVRDTICRSNPKNAAWSDWSAAVRIVAAMKPDVLILQETADNSGNNTGGGIDSVPQLETVIDLFMNGGSDPFRSGEQATEYVKLYDSALELPHVYVSESDDGFNRNVILSRWPFVDLNGDGRPTTPSFSTASGSSGVRGIQFAEINLPNETYLGDLVVSNAHLKAFGDSGSQAQRVAAATALNSYIWNFYEGAGTATVDPNNQVSDFPPATSVLDANTAIVWGGDYNEDELTNGRNGPVAISIDGTDKDASDAVEDSATEPFSGSRATQSSSKLDWMMWQDSVASARNQFIFNTQQTPQAQMPPELIGFGLFPPFNGVTASATASDHRPVIVDLVVPLGQSQSGPEPFDLVSPADGAVQLPIPNVILSWQASERADSYSVIVARDPSLTDRILDIQDVGLTTAFLFQLEQCQTYYWSVTAVNTTGQQVSSPEIASFSMFNPGDQNNDGSVDDSDFFAWVTNFTNQDPAGDVNGDSIVDDSDFFAWVTIFTTGC